MKRFVPAILFAAALGLGCVHHDHDDQDRYARDRHADICEAPAVGVCAGCEVSCRGDDAQATCMPGRSTPARGQEPAYCSQESVCRCLHH